MCDVASAMPGEPHTLNGHAAGAKGVLWKALSGAPALHIGSQVTSYLQQDENLLDLCTAVLLSHPALCEPYALWFCCLMVLATTREMLPHLEPQQSGIFWLNFFSTPSIQY